MIIQIIRVALFLAFIALGAVVGFMGNSADFSIYSEHGFDFALGKLIGCTIAIPLFSFLCIQTRKSLKKSSKYSLVLFMIITIFLCLLQYKNIAKNINKRHLSITHKKNEAQFIITANEINKGKPLSDEQLKKLNLGKFYNATEAANRARKSILKIISNYNNIMNNIVIENALTPHTLKNKQSRDQYNNSLNHAKKCILSYSQKLNFALNKYQVEIKNGFNIAYKETDRTKTHTQSREDYIEKELKEITESWNDFFNIEVEIMHQIQNIYLLLDECEGYFSFNNHNEIIFDDNANVERYNNFMAKLTDLENKEEIIHKKITMEIE